MHSTFVISLAFGLLGIDSVVAGPCKPSSSVTTAATETSTSQPSSSVLSDTTVSTGVPEATTTTTIAVSESSLVSTDIESTISVALSHTSGLSTESTLESTVTSAMELSTQTTSDATSSAAETSTAASIAVSESSLVPTDTESTISVALSHTSGLSTESTLEPTVTSVVELSTQTTSDATSSVAETSTAALSIPTLFSLSPHGGPADGETLLTTGQSGNTLALGASGSQWSEAHFTYDEATGHLLIGTQAICVYYYNDNRSSMTICPTYDSPQFAPMVCEPPTGRNLKCSVPAVKCVTGAMRPVCTTSDTAFKTFYSGLWYGTAYNVFLSEPDRAITDLFDPIDLVVNAL
ncbi:hypothetical protein DER45DRAFT_634786 [Fusarium avenaceum]|nr:hypothetical protein DER45DRAFT_634786 [Fusarium avenaceum]